MDIKGKHVYTQGVETVFMWAALFAVLTMLWASTASAASHPAPCIDRGECSFECCFSNNDAFG